MSRLGDQGQNDRFFGVAAMHCDVQLIATLAEEALGGGRPHACRQRLALNLRDLIAGPNIGLGCRRVGRYCGDPGALTAVKIELKPRRAQLSGFDETKGPEMAVAIRDGGETGGTGSHAGNELTAPIDERLDRDEHAR